MAVMPGVKKMTLQFSAKVSCLGGKEECWFFELSYRTPGGKMAYPGTTSTKPKSLSVDESFWKGFEEWLRNYRKRTIGPFSLEGGIDFSFRGEDGLVEAEETIRCLVHRVFPELV